MEKFQEFVIVLLHNKCSVRKSRNPARKEFQVDLTARALIKPALLYLKHFQDLCTNKNIPYEIVLRPKLLPPQSSQNRSQ